VTPPRLAVRAAWCVLLLALVSGDGRPPLQAQSVGPSTGGVVARDQALRRLGHHQRVLVIGAHPDDEDTELLAVLARSNGAEAAYLSLTRGEGGQNLIGTELGEALGLLRTGELLAARSLDGARQFFSRAYDFGYAKTLDDTWAHWPQDTILKDVVRIVRRFRPQVIVSIFSGAERDGHGQHQAAGWAAREAFRVAGDPAVFPELATEEGVLPWDPQKLYRSTRFDQTNTTMTLEGGTLDPVTGQSFHQIAMRSRSLHRSQDMGVPQAIGPSPVFLTLLEDRTGHEEATESFFGGIDTTLSGLPAVQRAGPGAVARWRALEAALAGAMGEPGTLRSLRAELGEAWRALPAGAEVSHVVEDQLAAIDQAWIAGAEVVCDARSLEPVAIPGRALPLVLSCWNAGADPVTFRPDVAFRGVPVGAPVPVTLPARTLWSDTLSIPLPDTTRLSEPYFLELDRSQGGALYRWPARHRRVFGTPFGEPWLLATFTMGAGPVLRQEVVYRTIDQALGEIRRPVPVVPRLTVTLETDLRVRARADSGKPERIAVTVENQADDTTRGSVRLTLPPGWSVVESQPVVLAGRGARRSVSFMVTPPPGGGEWVLQATAEDERGQRYDRGLREVAYPHINPTWWTVAARTSVRVVEFSGPAAGRRIGYVRGAADRIPEALQGLGVTVELLDPPILEEGDLSRYDVIVIGPRAYETDSTVVRHNERLVAYAREGGVLVVQYQQHRYFRGHFPPRPMDVADRHDRVTDEGAAVTLLVPDDPLFRGPNRIGSSDWDGWIQERGLYYPRTWDPAYTALLRMQDPGESPTEGALLTLRLGRGRFVYTGLSFFRQLPAGVPGAVRLFLNLLSLEPGRAVP